MDTARQERFEARITRQQKKLLQRAADLEGRTLTDFVVKSAQDAAQRAIEAHTVLELSARDQQTFVQALLRPPSPSKRLTRAARRYKRLRE
jgi:uncharacterized protein (DUF1778 family)